MRVQILEGTDAVAARGWGDSVIVSDPQHPGAQQELHGAGSGGEAPLTLRYCGADRSGTRRRAGRTCQAAFRAPRCQST